VATIALDRVWHFFTVRIWDARARDLPRWKAVLYRVSRVAFATARGYFDHRLEGRAAALTYFSVLSVVPFLAFAFAVLKGFGIYRSFIEGTVRPWLEDTFAANAPLYDAIDRILQFVNQTDVSRLGTAGVIFLLYTSVSLISTVEVALNDIFGAKASRPFVRQLTDYVTMVVTTPLLLFVGGTFAAAAQSSRIVVFLRERLALGPVIDFALGFTPILVVALALFAMYMILPNVRVRPMSALLGAIVAALGWQGALILQIQLQMGVARYNALYSFLGAIPIFLVWCYVSWLIVLVGAELASNHQNEKAVRRALQGKRADQHLRETIAIAAAAQIASDFLAGGPRRSASDLAELLEVPPPLIEEILELLVRAGLLVRIVSGGEIAWAPGRDLDDVRVSDLRKALRRDPELEDVRARVERQLGPDLQELLEAEEERRTSPDDPTLRELAARALDRGGSGRGPPRAGATNGHGREVMDAKQPDVPA
jgi:membrane protein